MRVYRLPRFTPINDINDINKSKKQVCDICVVNLEHKTLKIVSKRNDTNDITKT